MIVFAICLAEQRSCTHITFLFAVFLLCVRWSSYKLNNKTDKLSVFVSLVSTKIPFKGTGKEYIGDDKGVLHEAIKKCITQCCVQIRRRMVAMAAAREKADRKKQLSKYIPDVSRSFMTLLRQMADVDAAGASMLPPSKRRKTDQDAYQQIVDKLRIQPQEQRCAIHTGIVRACVSPSSSVFLSALAVAD